MVLIKKVIGVSGELCHLFCDFGYIGGIVSSAFSSYSMKVISPLARGHHSQDFWHILRTLFFFFFFCTFADPETVVLRKLHRQRFSVPRSWLSPTHLLKPSAMLTPKSSFTDTVSDAFAESTGPYMQRRARLVSLAHNRVRFIWKGSFTS